jgi:hypothetical protein
MKTPSKTKFQATLDSRNFFVNLISIVLLAFTANGLPISVEPGDIIDAISTQDFGLILGVILPNFLNPIMKLINKTANWGWGFLKSTNFWTQTLTTLLVGLELISLQFPTGAAQEIIDAVFSGDIGLIIAALAINILNPLLHFFRNKEETTPA